MSMKKSFVLDEGADQSQRKWREDTHCTGWDSLAYSVISQAVDDFRRMRKHGIIDKHGHVVKVWPVLPCGEKAQLFGLRKHEDVFALVDFFCKRDYHGRTGLEVMLQACGSKIDSDKIVTRLGVKR